MGVGIFSDCVFFLKVNSLPLKERSKLKSSITSNGGALSFVLNEKCTHVVVIDAATLNSTQQRSIQKHCISVVNPDFIWKSIQGELLVEVDRQDDGKQCEAVLDEAKDDKKRRFLSKFLNENQENLAERDFSDEEFEDDGDECNLLPEDTEVAKYSFFEKDKEVAVVELLCFNENSPFPFKVCTTRGVPSTSQKEFTFQQVDTAKTACDKYGLRIDDLIKKGFRQVDKVPPQAESFASQALQKVLLGEALNVAELPPDVAGFVETIWVDALGHLDAILSCPVKNISLNDVSKAEGILHQVRNALTKGDREEDIHQMMLEFYRFIPHKEKMLSNIDKKFLTVKQDLCQLIRDMVSVCETSLPKSTLSTTAKYQALRCRIEHVDPNSEEFHRVKRDHSNDEFKMLRVFRIGRLSESTNFKSDLGNVRSLLHASSPCNFVGILSRGLMLPKIIVEEFGWERTDIGNLGSGIYFSDSISTSVKYADPSTLNGGRLLVVCDVALGNTKPFYKRDYTITEPPSGFHSIHGVRSEGSNNSDFKDDEYVVYDVNQVKMRYIVQFCTHNDDLDSLMDPVFSHLGQTPEDNVSTSETLEDISLEDLPEPTQGKGGLQGIDGQQIPLESIHVKARLMDLAAQVVIFQTYKNNSNVPIEAKYVFPLDSTAAVCGFEAFINGKHIVGEVKEKQQAHREYRTAIEKGHGAYLMDQDAPDVFTVSVGNLPPKSTVVIKISYVTELTFQFSWVSFSIPGTVASWQQENALKENTQDVVTKVGIESGMAPKGSFCLEMSIDMPRKIENIMCHRHGIKIKKTDCKAVIQTLENSSLNEDGFALDIFLEEGYIPRMWVETHPDEDSEACMLIFQPQFENGYEDVNITICLDCSNSMESCFKSAKLVALLAVNCLYYKSINIILFGSTYKEFYFYPCQQKREMSEMQTFIKMAKPNMGSTEFWKPLQSLCLLRPSTGCQRVLLISDGHLQNEHLVLQILKKNKGHINLLTCGVGATANKHMLRFLAHRGAGAFEYFGDKSKSSWKDQMDKQDKRLQSPACTVVSVKWRQFGRNPPEPVQAPANMPALFFNDHLLVYGFVPHCTQATLKALINSEELENMVSTTKQQKTTGTILHKLTARALIRDYEDGILHEKEHENEMKKQELKSYIIELSVRHSIVTQFTSFVAVEKRSKEDMNIEPNVFQIISAEDVDILPYMNWTADESKSKSVSDDDDSDMFSVLYAVESENEHLPQEREKETVPEDDFSDMVLGQALTSNIYSQLSTCPSRDVPPPPSATMRTPAPSPHYRRRSARQVRCFLSVDSSVKESLSEEREKETVLDDFYDMAYCGLSVDVFGNESLPEVVAPTYGDLSTHLRELGQPSSVDDMSTLDFPMSPAEVPQTSDSVNLIARNIKRQKSVFRSSQVAPAVDLPVPSLQPLYSYQQRKYRKQERLPKRFVVPSWSSLSALQSQDGFWQLTPELGKLLRINVGYLSEVFLIKNGISSLGSRGTEEIYKLIATLLVLQIIRIYNLLDEIKFKSLMKLDQSLPTSLSYPSIKRAIEWAVKTDRQYPGICNRLGLGKDWDHATRQLLGKEPVSAASDLYTAISH
ncbi:protein mono-ADP-ribosyltransferase PARP4-like isoform X2 [Mixophyes fleayi]|uniref:protein mono-ADP-ribosyltransferase PARP4-like isoform X2 n=1 Tax=Mixophyes fleayi TaxID=3061075 RepID=UPI003F4DA932